MQLVVDRDGTIRCLYGEALDLAALGTPCIRRASHGEPDPDGQGWVDLAPVGGASLGPFERRSQALAAEVEWLEAHWLAVAPQQPRPPSGREVGAAASPRRPSALTEEPAAG